jgi:hypothetical protein
MHLLGGTIEADRQIAQLNQVFNLPNVTKEQKFYGMCLIYLILTEGIYDETLRDFLLWHQNCMGTICPDLQDISIGEVKEELELAGASPILFQGWQRHIRNAIAHARFSYSEATDRATFDDVSLSNPADTFHGDLSYEDLGQLVMSLYFVVYLFRVVLVARHHVGILLAKAEQLLGS